MGKDPTGKRPTPTIATGKKPSYDTDPHGGTDHSRESATKSPTGSRPDPGILNLTHPPAATVPGPVKKPIKHTPMPTPNRDRGTNRGKAEGGGSY